MGKSYNFKNKRDFKKEREKRRDARERKIFKYS
jgi:hypothetical protein